MASDVIVGEQVFVTFHEHHALLEMKNGQNKLDVEFVEKLHKALDEVERNQNIMFLITVGEGKYYSTGLDLEKMLRSEEKYGAKFQKLCNQLLIRLLTFPLPTVAAINGHAFAAGALLALAHDYRIMRTQRGWFSLPEIHLKLQFPPGMIALIKQKIHHPAALTDVVLMGRRLTAEQSLLFGIVQGICDNTELLSMAAKMVLQILGKEALDRDHLITLKCDLYRDTLEALGMVTSKL